MKPTPSEIPPESRTIICTELQLKDDDMLEPISALRRFVEDEAALGIPKLIITYSKPWWSGLWPFGRRENSSKLQFQTQEEFIEFMPPAAYQNDSVFLTLSDSSSLCWSKYLTNFDVVSTKSMNCNDVFLDGYTPMDKEWINSLVLSGVLLKIEHDADRLKILFLNENLAEKMGGKLGLGNLLP